MSWGGKSKKHAKKPSYRKAKKAVGKAQAKKARKNLETFSLKAKTTFNMTPTQGVSVSNYIYSFFDLVGTWGGSVTKNSEFMLYSSLYDKVRINSMKVTITPRANVLDMVNAQADAEYTVNGDNMMYSVIDRDGAPPASIAAFQRYSSMKKTSLLKKQVRYYSVKYPKGVWLDAQGPLASPTLNNQLGLTGGIAFYAENILEDRFEVWNEPYAQVEIEYNCVFMGKTSAAISVSDSGAVTLTPWTPPTTIPYSICGGFSGTIHDTRLVQDTSGQMVEVPKTDLDTEVH